MIVDRRRQISAGSSAAVLERGGARAKRSGTSSFGFTLLELMVVLLLLGIFTSIFSLRIGKEFYGGDLRLAGRMVIGRIGELRSRAVYGRKEQTLAFNIDRNAIYRIDPAKDVKASTDWTFGGEQRMAGESLLPNGVRIEDVVILSMGKIQEGEARIRFFANGCIEKSLIHLRSENDSVYTLEINPLTGLVKVHDRYVEQKIGP